VGIVLLVVETFIINLEEGRGHSYVLTFFSMNLFYFIKLFIAKTRQNASFLVRISQYSVSFSTASLSVCHQTIIDLLDSIKRKKLYPFEGRLH
jgi:hypothetical protein